MRRGNFRGRADMSIRRMMDRRMAVLRSSQGAADAMGVPRETWSVAATIAMHIQPGEVIENDVVNETAPGKGMSLRQQVVVGSYVGWCPRGSDVREADRLQDLASGEEFEVVSVREWKAPRGGHVEVGLESSSRG